MSARVACAWKIEPKRPTRQTQGITLMHLPSSNWSHRLAAAAGVAVFLSGCASSPVADEKIAVAKASVQRAEQSGAPQAAPVELASARDKLTQAEKANTDRNLKPANQLADQANIDAQVAEATAQQQRSRKAAMEFDASMQTLRQETLRTSPTAQ
jgi:hypothetical protein